MLSQTASVLQQTVPLTKMVMELLSVEMSSVRSVLQQTKMETTEQTPVPKSKVMMVFSSMETASLALEVDCYCAAEDCYCDYNDDVVADCYTPLGGPCDMPLDSQNRYASCATNSFSVVGLS